MSVNSAPPTAQMAGLTLGAAKKKKRAVKVHHTDILGVGRPLTASPAPQNVTVPASGPAHETHQPAQGAADVAQNMAVSHRRYTDQHEWLQLENGQTRSFYTFRNVVPPEAGTQFHAVEEGIASAKFMRCSMYNVPETEQLRAATKLPVSVTIRPFAPLLATESPVPQVDMRTVGRGYLDDADDVGPVRCRRCRAYISPSMHFTSGTKFTCCVCRFPNNEVPADYGAMLDPATNMRVDYTVRPELHRGVYDILVPPTYNAGGADVPPAPLHHVFLIDVTVESVQKRLPSLVADTIRSVLFQHQQGQPQKFAIILFDQHIHFYNVSPQLEQTQIVVSSDLDDPFVPFSDGLFGDPQESALLFEDALNHLDSLSDNDTLRADSSPCFSAALRTAMMCLEDVGGGKITTVLSTLPSFGPGALTFKENRTQALNISPEAQKHVYKADSPYYHLLAKDFVDKNVGLDCLVVSTVPVDLSNVGWLCSVTGGKIHRFQNFDLDRDGSTFMAHFVSSVTNTKGYSGQLKLRCSNGLQVTQYYGTVAPATDVPVVGAALDPKVPILSEDQSFTVLLEYDGKLDNRLDCHFQAALLYTDPSGVRKVRVINLVLAVSERLSDVFNFMDQDAIVATIVRDTLSFVGKQTFQELRESINEKVVDVFTHYRAKSELGHNSNRTMTSQLLLPDALVHLPMFMLAFLKSAALRDSKNINADARLEDIYRMLNMPIEQLMYHLYPALIELHSLQPEEGLIADETVNPSKFLTLPSYKDLSLHKLEDGVYIMTDGVRTYIWVRPDANPLLIQDLFGEEVGSVNDINANADRLPELDTEISEKAHNIIRYFNRLAGLPSLGSAGVQIIREGIDGSDVFFKERLLEDGAVAMSLNLASYPEYLSKLHGAIKVKLENDKAYSKLKSSIDSAERHDTLAQRLLQF